MNVAKGGIHVKLAQNFDQSCPLHARVFEVDVIAAFGAGLFKKRERGELVRFGIIGGSFADDGLVRFLRFASCLAGFRGRFFVLCILGMQAAGNPGLVGCGFLRIFHFIRRIRNQGLIQACPGSRNCFVKSGRL